MYKSFFKQKTAYEMSASLVGSEMCIRDRCTTIESIAKCQTPSITGLSLIHI
ncbi:hypothetical protein JMUB7536_27680 [Staphylococcus aureus]